MSLRPPLEARWVRPQPRRELPAGTVQRMMERAIPNGRLTDADLLADGYRNANWKVRLEGISDAFDLRLYEHDPSLCAEEADLLHLVAGSVPVPEMIHAETTAGDQFPPFAVLRFVEGISFHELERAVDRESAGKAAKAIGGTLAAIHQFRFPRSGWIGPGPEVTAPLLPGANAGLRFVDMCLANPELRQRMAPDLRERTHDFIWSHAAQMTCHDSCSSLVHCDFGSRNILIGPKSLAVVAVLDWEFAVSGCPLADIGHFLRYEKRGAPLREPHFTQGYRERGGTLPENWKAIARIMDLIALVESLTHVSLPHEIADELLELVAATLDDRDPAILNGYM